MATRLQVAATLAVTALLLLLTAPVPYFADLTLLSEAWCTTHATSWMTQGVTELRLLDLGVEGWANEQS